MVEQRQTQKIMNRTAAPAGQRPAAAATLTPKEVFGMLRRHILLIVSLTILGFMVSGAAWYFLRRYFPKYTARTFIKVLPPVVKDPMAIRGAQVAKDITYGHRLSMVSLMTQQSSLRSLIDRDKIQETEWFKHFGDIKSESIIKAFKDLKRYFSAHAQRDGDYIVLSMTCGNKTEAALIVNEMVELFLQSRGSAKREDVADKLARLEDQRLRVQRDLNAAEDALDEVRRRWGFADLEQHVFRHTITEKLRVLELGQDELVMQIKDVQTSIETLRRQAIGPIDEQIQVQRQIENDPIMLNLAQQLASLQATLASRLTKFGENHRVVREMQELINATKEERRFRREEIAELVRQANLKNAQDGLVMLTARLEELERMRQETAAKERELDAARVQYSQRMVIRNERRQMLDSIKKQIEAYKIVHDDPETPKVQFAGYAPEPMEISSPKWKIYFPTGTMLGFMAGIGLVFLIELLNDLVRTPRDVARFLRIPLLGVIPDAAEDEQAHDVELCHVVRQAPYSIISESYRRLRTNLKLSSSAQSARVLLVASGAAGDGKTAVAVNLAATFVAENKKVLLIDANFRRPSLQSIFPRPQQQPEQSEFGLSTLLAGLCGYQEIIRPGGIEGLSLIEAGPLPPNPAELLGGELMEQLIKRQRESYDYVIVDGPPVLLVSDAKVLTRLVDGTVLVFNAAATKRGAALRTIRELREVDATIIGCVLLAVKAMKGGYFHEQFKSYQKYQELQLAGAAV